MKKKLLSIIAAIGLTLGNASQVIAGTTPSKPVPQEKQQTSPNNNNNADAIAALAMYAANRLNAEDQHPNTNNHDARPSTQALRNSLGTEMPHKILENTSYEVKDEYLAIIPDENAANWNIFMENVLRMELMCSKKISHFYHLDEQKVLIAQARAYCPPYERCARIACIPMSTMRAKESDNQYVHRLGRERMELLENIVLRAQKIADPKSQATVPSSGDYREAAQEFEQEKQEEKNKQDAHDEAFFGDIKNAAKTK